jgi:hypothetical protein
MAHGDTAVVCRLLRKIMRPDCFKTFVRCGVEALPPDCKRFSTLAEQAILGSLDQNTPTLFILTARQGVGKSFLAATLYEKMINERRDVLPAVLCGGEKLTRDFERVVFLSLSRALYDFLVKTQMTRRRPEDAGITDLRQLSFVLEMARLKVFLIIDEAHLVPDLDRLMDKIRELEGELQYAGILLMFQDLDVKQKEKIKDVLVGRGGTRFAWGGELTERDLLPAGDHVKDIRNWAEKALGDAVAAAVYAKLAEVYGFRAANHFAQHFRSPKPSSGDERELSAALVRALAKRYGLPTEVAVEGGCRADLIAGKHAVDVKICSDPNSLKKAVEDDVKKNCNVKYIVVGRCRTAVPPEKLAAVVETDAASLAYATRMAAGSMNISSIIDKAAEALAELIDLSALGAEEHKLDVEKITLLLEELCRLLGPQGEARYKLVNNRYMKPIAATLGIELRTADDVNKVVQQLQKMELPYYLRLDGARVRCIQRKTKALG